jgi:hypothetical protein
MKRKSIILIVIAALLAVFCNCAPMLPSHACCQPGTARSPHPIRHQFYDSNKDQHDRDQTELRACCQPQAAMLLPAVHTFDSASPFDEAAPPASRVRHVFRFRIDPRLQSVESRVFIADHSKRRCLEFCVLLS